MNRDSLKQIICDHRDYWLDRDMIKRNYPIEGKLNYCFIGIRRSGKSYLMFQQIHNYIDVGISQNDIVYVNFEDERLLEMKADSFNLILEIGLERSEGRKPYFFFDEIQNVEGWERFVRRLSDMNYIVCVTGSNSKMLSKEIASTLGGRFFIVTVYPYDFSEYRAAKGLVIKKSDTMSTRERAEIYKIYEEYVGLGAFPELVHIKQKKLYLSSIYQTIYLGDIVTRNRLNNDFAVRLILKKLAESVMQPVSYSRLTNILKSAGASIGKQTVINYIGYMKDSFLIFSVGNYIAKLVEKETSPKYYFMDTGLLGMMILNGETAQLENLVAIELIRRYGMENVYYIESNVEIDFYVPEENLAVQVSYSLSDSEETLRRETEAFQKLKKYIPKAKCLIITHSEEAEVKKDETEITIMPAWKWLCDGEGERWTTN